MTTWFTSDTHWAHANIIRYCSRPFKDVREMDECMAARWNERVRPEDVVYHLGDFALCKARNLAPIVAQLNGRKILVIGNHDRSPKAMLAAGFSEVHKSLELEVDGLRVLMRHYPLGKHDGDVPEQWGPYDYRFHGHVHEKWINRGSEINVGVDVWNFYPRTFGELVEGIPARQIPKLDWKRHHNVDKL